MSYACISQTLGLHGFYLSSRTPFRSLEWVQERIRWAQDTGLMDTTTGLAVADGQHWRTHCLNGTRGTASTVRTL